MSWTLLLEQLLNGLKFGLMLFLLSTGVTLIFGVMGLVNIAHGAMFTLGAFLGFAVGERHGYLAGWAAALLGTGLAALAVELLVMRRLYRRHHLDQVLGTFGLMLIVNELIVIFWGRDPMFASMPEWLSGSVSLMPELQYPAYRIAISIVALAAGALVYALVAHTRVGMLIRAGAEKREVAEALGVNINLLFSLVFVLGAMLAALAGVMMGPLITVESGVGEPLLILALVIIIVGGAGSMKGCLFASLLIGVLDTLARAYLSAVGDAGRALANMVVYVLMLLVLLVRPQGMFRR